LSDFVRGYNRASMRLHALVRILGWLALMSSMPPAAAVAQAPSERDGGGLLLTEREFSARGPVWLNESGWKYRPGDNAAWALPELDDAPWERVATTAFTASALPRSGWHGVGWFRLHVRVEPGLSNRPLGLGISHWGASEIYLDGRLLHRFGHIGSTPAGELAFNPRGAEGPALVPTPIALTLSADRPHVLAVRVSAAALAEPSRGSARWLLKTPGPTAP